MMLRVDFLQALARDMRVYLCGRHVAVTEQHLYYAKIRAMIQQMSRECVPQRVRRQRLADAGLLRIPLDDVPERLAGHAVAAAGRKQVIGLALAQDLAPAALEVPFQPALCLLAQRYQ